ncbi:hypothetical protein FHS43_006607 [Streptosporangium becharense]|uniref:DUF3040 domain-containing protein n=1 Tax=Streptosporangium becharense TaxID=1816182 RepID=A0A7W9MDQ7_9ACTN|nr:DUF3040 domain-containing protein [Streptosporangium becharense]MBB2915287.1 hypothetical protein [Streptosporangium becharense]MBB5817015.1 hypothetical protein [Streptosporangium becharense]
MGLSRQERRRLAEIEERLAFEDPDLDAALARPSDGPDLDVPATGNTRVRGYHAWFETSPTPLKTQCLLAILVILVVLFALLVLLSSGETLCPGGPTGRSPYCGTGPESPVVDTGRLR